MDSSLISVIIPVYNGAKYIRACVKCIQEQTYPNIEILLINDGSTDDSLSICRQIEAEEPKVVVFSTENHGQGHARNIGIEHARGDYIGFCDVDDQMDSSMYCVLHEMISTHNADMVGCDHSSLTGTTVTYKRGGGIKETQVGNRNDALRAFAKGYGIAWGVWDKLFSARKLKKIRFPEEKIHAEDTIFLLDFILQNNVFCWAKLGLYWHNDSNAMSYTKQSWSRSNLGLTMFYQQLADALEDNSIQEEKNEAAVRYYQNLLSTYVRCCKHKYHQEAAEIRKEMIERKAKMKQSSLSTIYKLDFLLCVYLPHLGPKLNFMYK